MKVFVFKSRSSDSDFSGLESTTQETPRHVVTAVSMWPARVILGTQWVSESHLGTNHQSHQERLWEGRGSLILFLAGTTDESIGKNQM